MLHYTRTHTWRGRMRDECNNCFIYPMLDAAYKVGRLYGILELIYEREREREKEARTSFCETNVCWGLWRWVFTRLNNSFELFSCTCKFNEYIYYVHSFFSFHFPFSIKNVYMHVRKKAHKRMCVYLILYIYDFK